MASQTISHSPAGLSIECQTGDCILGFGFCIRMIMTDLESKDCQRGKRFSDETGLTVALTLHRRIRIFLMIRQVNEKKR